MSSPVDRLQRRCRRCRTSRPIEEFYRTESGLTNTRCERCACWCTRCGQRRRLDDFDISPARGRSGVCKACRRGKLARYYHDRQAGSDRLPAMAVCGACEIEKPIADFYVDRRYTAKVIQPCRRCRNANPPKLLKRRRRRG